ncbi:MAG: hypothetical protein H6694_00125 [Candidatus Latescibacteria bacterium]|nr:hypothetical protein [Candidatus Latescibacterota bacterium]
MSAPRRQDDAAPDVAGLRQRLRRVAEDVAARWGYRPLHVPSASAESTLARAAEWGAADAEPAGLLRLVAWGPSAAGGDALRLCLEVTGSASPALEAELIELVRDVLGELGLSPLGARLNAPGTSAAARTAPARAASATSRGWKRCWTAAASPTGATPR